MAKVFQILVPDNTLVSRIIFCENQVTELFVIDRADKNFVLDYSSDLNKPALYILINRDRRKLYIGETDDSFKRLKNHEAKDFWTEAIIFHSTSDTLSTTEVKWLEAKTFEEIKRMGYYDLSENKQVPPLPPLKRNQIITLEETFKQAKEYICAAGFDFFLKKKMEDDLEEKIVEVDNTPVEVAVTPNPNVWLLPSNLKYFDLKKCFKERGQVFWQIKSNFQKVKKGDRGYIYSSRPDKAIIYSFEVVESNIPYRPIMDIEDRYSSDGNNKYWCDKGGCFALLKMSEVANQKELTLVHLKQNGLGGAPQNATMLSQKKFEKILSYIDGVIINPVRSLKKSGQKPPFKFSMIGLKQGDVITFNPTNTKVIISEDDKTIIYKGDKYTLTGFCKKFMPDDKRIPSNAYQGPLYFSYKNKALTKIRKEQEKELSE